MWVLVPIKAFSRAKQRLAAVLPPAERTQLAQAMASDVLGVLSRHAHVDRIIVCSDDPRAQHMARSFGAGFLAQAQPGDDGLNNAVNEAARSLANEGATDLAVVHGDLPLLAGDELDRFLFSHARQTRRAITITPDRWRSGTNLLAWRPLAEFAVDYGPDSFRRHCDLARGGEYDLNVCELPGGAFDIDRPEDLRAFACHADASRAPATHRLLQQYDWLQRYALAHAPHAGIRNTRENVG